MEPGFLLLLTIGIFVCKLILAFIASFELDNIIGTTLTQIMLSAIVVTCCLITGYYPLISTIFSILIGTGIIIIIDDKYL